MILTRYITVDKNGNINGLARSLDLDVSTELEYAILEEEESLIIPDPYPENSVALFTEKGQEEHEHLISLWIENAHLQEYFEYMVKKLVFEADTNVPILYQDDDQIIISNESFKNLHLLSETIVEKEDTEDNL